MNWLTALRYSVIFAGFTVAMLWLAGFTWLFVKLFKRTK